MIRRFIIASLTIFTLSCTTVIDKTEVTNKRIILKETTLVNGYYMYIIEVDNQEFLVNSRGGIQPIINNK